MRGDRLDFRCNGCPALFERTATGLSFRCNYMNEGKEGCREGEECGWLDEEHDESVGEQGEVRRKSTNKAVQWMEKDVHKA